MYAVIKAGGHQYRVSEGDTLEIDLQPQAAGSPLVFNEVLLVQGANGIKVGQPVVPGASVEGEILEHFRAPKIVVFTYKRRKNFKKKRGHKQPLTRISIKKINV